MRWPWQKRPQKRRVILVELGRGDFLIGHTIKDGCPGFVISPAPSRGPVGEAADHCLPDGMAPDGSIAIVFTTPAAIAQHRTLLMSMCAEWERWAKGQDKIDTVK